MEDLRVSLIQSDLHWEKPEANLAMFEEKIWQLPSSDLIVLPEMFTTGFSVGPEPISEPVNGRTLRWMKQMASQTGATLIGSYIIKSHPVFYNRLYVVHPTGEYSHYDKRHLFTLAGEDQSFAQGLDRLIVKVKGWRICPMICYDLRFPVWSRSRSSADDLFEYEVLVYVANWPVPRINAWDTLLSARAIENIAFSIGVNRTGKDGAKAEYNGHSAVYNFKGDQLVMSEKEENLSLKLSWSELQGFRNRFPFQADADQFEII